MLLLAVLAYYRLAWEISTIVECPFMVLFTVMHSRDENIIKFCDRPVVRPMMR